MNFPVPRIIRSTLAEAVAAGCDCVMLRHDGWPILVNCVGEGCNILSAATDFGPLHQALRHLSYRDINHLEHLEKTAPLEPLSALFVGAKPRGTGPITSVHIYDMWWFDDQDIQMHSYRERYALARSNIRKLDSRFKMVTVQPIGIAPQLWTTVANDPEQYKGLVCRRSKDAAGGELYTIPYYKEAPGGLV
jgi:hypothetical protein